MVPFARIGLAPLSLSPRSALLLMPIKPAKAQDQPRLKRPFFTDCQLLRRAISRRACQARLWREEQVDTAENK
jgi:hypothetical protein